MNIPSRFVKGRKILDQLIDYHHLKTNSSPSNEYTSPPCDSNWQWTYLQPCTVRSRLAAWRSQHACAEVKFAYSLRINALQEAGSCLHSYYGINKFIVQYRCEVQWLLFLPFELSFPNTVFVCCVWFSQWKVKVFLVFNNQLSCVTDVTYFGLQRVERWFGMSYSRLKPTCLDNRTTLTATDLNANFLGSAVCCDAARNDARNGI